MQRATTPHWEDEYHSGSDADEAGGRHDVVEDPEVWMDYHSEELVTMWHQLLDQAAATGVYVLDKCAFSDFTEFCFKHSTGKKPPC